MIALQPNGVDAKFAVKFSTPADIRGTAFLQVEHGDADDDLWIYLPALKKSRRLVASNKKDSFVGSDFSYGDISLPRVAKYRHTIIRNETIDEVDAYVIESVPIDDTVKSNSGYSKKITWVRSDNFVEAKVEAHEILKDHSDCAAQRPNVVQSQIEAVEKYATFCRVIKPCQQFGERGFSCAVFSDECDALAGTQSKADVTHCPPVASRILKANVFEDETFFDRLRHHSSIREGDD